MLQIDIRESPLEDNHHLLMPFPAQYLDSIKIHTTALKDMNTEDITMYHIKQEL